MNHLFGNEVFGLVKTNIDVHTLGITTLSHLLRDCGYGCFISPAEISIAVEQVQKLNKDARIITVSLGELCQNKVAQDALIHALWVLLKCLLDDPVHT